jgi:hypothetical protein
MFQANSRARLWLLCIYSSEAGSYNVTDSMAVEIYLGHPLLPEYCYPLYKDAGVCVGDEK